MALKADHISEGLGLGLMRDRQTPFEEGERTNQVRTKNFSMDSKECTRKPVLFVTQRRM